MYCRSDSYYEPYVYTSLAATGFLTIFVMLALAAVLGKKIEKISPKIIYFYLMSLLSLIFVSEGLAIFITIVVDLISTLGKFNIDIKKAFLTCSSLLIVSIPSYLFHWNKIQAGLGLEEEEKIAWPYYKYMVLGLSAVASLVFIATLFHEIVSSLLNISTFNLDFFNKVLGYGLIGIIVWIYHWSWFKIKE